MAAENAKFEENNRALEEQNKVFSESNTALKANVKELEEAAAKFKQIYGKLQGENEKLANVRDGLQEQLNVSNEYNEEIRPWDLQPDGFVPLWLCASVGT